MQCQFCNKILPQLEEIQAHQVNCPAIENKNYVPGKHVVKVTISWNKEEIDEEETKTVSLIVSDMNEKIGLKYSPIMNLYQSDKVEIQPGKYSSQLIYNSNILPVKEFQVSLQTVSIVLQTQEVILSTDLIQQSAPQACGSANNNNLISPDPHLKNYILNKNAALQKKKKACDNPNYSVKNNQNSVVITLNTASFELFKISLLKYLDKKQAQNEYSFISTSQKEQAGSIVGDIIKVLDDTSSHMYTVNLYRTKCNALINGPKYRHFATVDLPVLTGEIDLMGSTLDTINANVKEHLTTTSINITNNDTTQSKGNPMTRENPRIQGDPPGSSEDLRPKRNCKNTSKMEEFKKKQKPKETVQKEKVCICKSSYRKTDFMIGCDYCEEWLHGTCMGGLTEENTSGIIKYMCPTCKESGKTDKEKEKNGRIEGESEEEKEVIQCLKDQLNDHQILAEKRAKEIIRLKERNDTLKGTNSEQGKQIEEKTSKQTALENKLSAQKKELAALRQRIKTLEEHETTLQTTISQQAGTISSQQLLINEYEIKDKCHFDLACSFMEEIEAEEEEGNESMDTLGQPELALTSTPHRGSKSMSKLRDVLDEQRKKINSLKAEIEEKNDEIKKLEGIITETTNDNKDEIKSLKKEIENLKNSLNLTEEATAKSNANEKVAIQKYNKILSEDGQLKLQCSELNIRLAEIEEENLALKAACDKSANEDLVEKLKKTLQDRENDLISLEQFFEESQTSRNALEEREKKWKTEKKEMEKAINTLKLSSDNEKRGAEDSRMSLEAARKELDSANQLNNVLRQKLAVIIGTNDASPSNENSITEVEQQRDVLTENYGKKCLFELKRKDLCTRGAKCKFDHNITNQCRTDEHFIDQVLSAHAEKMNFCPVELVSPGQCEPSNCKYNHDREVSNLRNKHTREKKTSRKLCYREMLERGSCPYQENCFFEHKIPESARTDPNIAQDLERIKQKTSKCVNEYFKVGGCNKQGNCRFSHDITEEQREDPSLQETMQKKYDALRANNPAGSNSSQNKQDILQKVLGEMNKLKKMIQNCP